MSRSPFLVLGIGNLLLSDEGVGVHAVRELARQGLRGAELIDGGTGGFHLLSCFTDYERVVIIDATMDQGAPGTLAVLQPRFASDFPRVLSAHDIGLRDLLESAALLGPLPRMHLVTVSVEADQPMGTELSAPVRAALPEVVDTVKVIVEHEAPTELRTSRDGVLTRSDGPSRPGVRHA